jgi:hypothetical protein
VYGAASALVALVCECHDVGVGEGIDDAVLAGGGQVMG